MTMTLKDKKTTDQGMAVVGLILNILVLSGLGSIIAGKQKTGMTQLILVGVGLLLLIIGLPLSLILIGIPILILAAIILFTTWVWGLITGIQMVLEAAN